MHFLLNIWIFRPAMSYASKMVHKHYHNLLNINSYRNRCDVHISNLNIHTYIYIFIHSIYIYIMKYVNIYVYLPFLSEHVILLP